MLIQVKHEVIVIVQISPCSAKKYFKAILLSKTTLSAQNNLMSKRNILGWHVLLPFISHLRNFSKKCFILKVEFGDSLCLSIDNRLVKLNSCVSCQEAVLQVESQS